VCFTAMCGRRESRKRQSATPLTPRRNRTTRQRTFTAAGNLREPTDAALLTDQYRTRVTLLRHFILDGKLA